MRDLHHLRASALRRSGMRWLAISTAGTGASLPSSRKLKAAGASDRPELERALAVARLHKAPVVVARMDRLTRSVAFPGTTCVAPARATVDAKAKELR